MVGKMEINPKKIIITPEISDQTDCGISIKIVLAFKSRVKSTMEIPKADVIIIGLRLRSPPMDPPTIIGRTGKIQGASTVRMPERNTTSKRNIMLARLFA